MTSQRVLRVFSFLPFMLSGAKRGSLAMLATTFGIMASVAPFPVDAALLDGETVATTDFRGAAPDLTTVIGPENRAVGPGVELTDFAGFLDINFSDTNILITAAMDQPIAFFEILRFEDVNGTIPAFTSVSLDSATNWTGLEASAIFFTSERIDVHLTGLGGLQGQMISLNLTGNGNGNGNGVIAEPPTYLLLGIAALAMLGIACRRRQRAA